MSAISKLFHLSSVNKIRMRNVIYIGFFCTAIDFVIVMFREDGQLYKN